MTTNAPRVPFLDLRIDDSTERCEMIEAVDRVFQHGRLVMGPEVTEIEETVATFCRRRYAVAVNSGTDALWLAMKALGLGAGDEVITTSLSWIATTNAIALTGATPVFADIRDDLNIDPASVRRLVTDQTRAIVPVHYTGRICDMVALTEIATQYDLAIIEDAAQAYGAQRGDKLAGGFGDLSCFSMNPMKVFAACGEAGMVLTDDKEWHSQLVSLRYNGCVNRETCVEPSLNGRMDTLQAAILLVRHRRLEWLLNRRRENAVFYDQALQGIVETPPAEVGRHAYYTYMIQVDRRDELKQFLEENGIETKIQHPILMPDQPAYREKVRCEVEKSRQISKRILCLPVHEKLDTASRDYVVNKIREFYK